SKWARVVSVPYDELLRATDAQGGLHQESEQLFWRQQVGGLPPDQRVALTMHVLDDESFEAIGHALGISRASAYRLYRRALASLGQELADERPPLMDSGHGSRRAGDDRDDHRANEQEVERAAGD